MENIQYQIHGDNIVECTRTFDYILLATKAMARNVIGPYGSITCPRYNIELHSGDNLSFTFLPGYGRSRWNQDILGFIKSTGGQLREAADAIVTRIDEKVEKPLFAMEFCGALPAGNNAWQRNGRAFSFAHAGIPYFYLAELGGYELTVERSLKSERWPNPAVPFSYLSMTRDRGSICLPVYEANAGAKTETLTNYGQVFGRDDFVEYIRLVLVGDPPTVPARNLKVKCSGLVGILAASRSRQDGLSASQWKEAQKTIESGEPLTSYLSKHARIPWRKTAYIADLPDSARRFMGLAAIRSYGLTSSSLPLSFVPRSERKTFTADVLSIYGDVREPVAQWLAKQERDLAIAWVMGFKPRGDDARPDRGLPPLARMLIGEKTDLLTFVYGPAPADQWGLLRTAPGILAARNGLWEAILGVSDAILLDGSTMPSGSSRALLKQSWASSLVQKTEPLRVNPTVLNLGEQDADTALHLIFASLGSDIVFEGMCNPPGGDWSGISFVWTKEGEEHRWLTLPRVSNEGGKRPDHVFAVFGVDNSTICLCVESKEKPNLLEAMIGPRLIDFTKTLFEATPSVWRRDKKEPWISFTKERVLQSAIYVSMGAYIADPQNPFGRVRADTNLDILFGFEFSQDASKCVVYARALTEIGQKVIKFIVGATAKNASVEFQQS